ncbi:uncharacterized protein LOC125041529 isoform X2 [Penaeus chinensis]|uniref:uncharacterized protein LOC125041529 isoform X2 n=1 Tax=Penaeus chinensis TaxID=139456 RepID=UPI001FB68A5C|nr:uncharacterized protein LOC125041529 isoform X2 [Penaeus chinensis]
MNATKAWLSVALPRRASHLKPEAAGAVIMAVATLHAEEGEHPAKGAQVPSERGRPGERSPWPADGSAASLSQHPLSSLPYQDGSAPASAVTLAKPQPHTSAQVSRGL